MSVREQLELRRRRHLLDPRRALHLGGPGAPSASSPGPGKFPMVLSTLEFFPYIRLFSTCLQGSESLGVGDRVVLDPPQRVLFRPTEEHIVFKDKGKWTQRQDSEVLIIHFPSPDSRFEKSVKDSPK